ncbi:MAG: erythromycin esterase family protein [Bacteroidales bacterium]
MNFYPKRIYLRLFLGTVVLCALALALNIRPAPVSLDISMLQDHLWEIHSIDPEGKSHSDLEFLKQELKDKQIVVLGESLHQDGSTFLAKTRLVKFLHRELDFNTLFFELGQYDLWRLQQDTALAPESAVYPFWCLSDQTQQLWKYIKETGIETVGFDIQCTGNLKDTARRSMLFNYMSGFGIDAVQAWPESYKFFQKIRGYFDHRSLSYAIKNSIIFPDKITTELDSMVCFLNRQPMHDFSQSQQFELKTHLSYIAGIKNQLVYISKYEAGEPPRLQWRDSLMAENFLSLLNEPQYKDKKIIVWIANLHAFNDNRQFYNKSFENLGERVKAIYGEKMYTLLFTSFFRYNSGEKPYDLSRFNSLEYALHTLNKPYLYLTNMDLAVLNPVVCRVNQSAHYSLSLKNMADGLFYINATQNVSYECNRNR